MLFRRVYNMTRCCANFILSFFFHAGRSGGQMTVKDFKKAARHCMYPGYTLMFSVLTFSSTRLLKLKYWFSIQILSTDFSNPLLDHPYLGMDLTYIYALLHDGYHIRSNKGMEVSWLYWSYKSHVITKLFNWQKFKLRMN